MSSREIEKIYQEKLKDLEMNPNPEVWNKIEATLVAQKKAKKKVIFWYSSLGSAAAILLLFLWIYPLNTNQTNTEIATTEISAAPKQQTNKQTVKQSPVTAAVKNTTKQEVTLPETTFVNKPKTKKAEPSVKTTTPTPTLLTALNNKISQPNTIRAAEKTSRKQVKNELKPTKENNKTLINTPPLKTSIKKSLDKTLLAEKAQSKATKIKKESVKRHWSIAPVISQYTYNALSKNSTIDTRLNNAKKTGLTNVAYGINIAYQASKKLKIKTGAHRITMAQNTQTQELGFHFSRISAYQNTVKKPVEINTSTPRTTKLVFSDVASTENSFTSLSRTNQNKEIAQQFSYLEIPIEVSYEFLKSKNLSFHLNGGFSTLFLTENNLTSTNTFFTESHGGVTNLNNLNFSINLGTDIEYHLSKKWFINLQPNVKFQTQTFNRNNNRPYLLGLSSGINYKF
ncbi:outer membrane beta-barrel protein [Wenyingzhuangia sp. IMCC45574]